jgi:hypothetical protein
VFTAALVARFYASAASLPSWRVNLRLLCPIHLRLINSRHSTRSDDRRKLILFPFPQPRITSSRHAARLDSSQSCERRFAIEAGFPPPAPPTPPCAQCVICQVFVFHLFCGCLRHRRSCELRYHLICRRSMRKDNKMFSERSGGRKAESRPESALLRCCRELLAGISHNDYRRRMLRPLY